ncbi:hypothetical protein HYC85_027688 [Camellia sinensis]|uniref:Leucine-rich repeat-containing N-terminal plant-type domain-containing protein n=1 Tax=Camellia sinensis TaxID=4442 RepID=A0A7J7FTT6_CAMSI|nr:hypothetical protein HYC85_027688 [Camellia sinensis]
MAYVLIVAQTFKIVFVQMEGVGFEKLSALRKLETLNLKWNDFDDSILPSLSALRSLKMLNLRANNIGGLFPPQGSSELIHVKGKIFATMLGTHKKVSIKVSKK